MAHLMPMDTMDSPTVAKACRNNIWICHGFPEDDVSDRDQTFRRQYFTNLYDYLEIR